MTSIKGSDNRPWGRAIIYALPITALMLGLIYYWFAIADRYTVFLYYHDMGPLVPDTAPFSRVTSSRYWMAGLVACGFVMVLYAAVNLLLGRAKGYRPPTWWRIWLICAPPLLIAIPTITMIANEPTLPLWNAAQVTVATLTGLALALQPGKLAAGQPGELLLLAIDGLGIMFVMTALNALERVSSWLEREVIFLVMLTLFVLAAGLFLLIVASALRIWQRKPGRATSLFLASFCVSYLLFPLLHHLFFTDGYFYITDSDNFFTQSLAMQLLTWILAAALAFSLTWLRQYLIGRVDGNGQLATQKPI